MKLIVLHGPPACGKLTIARELAAATGYRLFHNHLVVDLALSVFDFGTEPFVELREELWLSVVARAADAETRGLIFTFNPEATVRNDFIERLANVAQSHGSEVLFVEITCPEAVIEERIELPSRKEHQKLSSLATYRELRAQGAFDYPALPSNGLILDSSEHDPASAANAIVTRFAL